MSVLLVKVLWFKVDNPDAPVNLTDVLDMRVGRGLDIKNNVAEFSLKNPVIRFDSDGNLVYKHINEEGNIIFQENDQIKIWRRYTDDMADVEDTVWENNVEEPSNDYLAGVYYVVDFEMPHDNKINSIKLKCADKSFILFNRLMVEAFTEEEGFTAPQLIQKVVRKSSQAGDKKVPGAFQGTDEDSGVYYFVDARFDTETDGGDGTVSTGYIQSSRRTLKEDGETPNPDTSFPVTSMAKVWKPVYEWIGELSNTEYINTDNELATKLVYGRPFLFWIDEDNKFHWVETTKEISDDGADNITVGTTNNIISHKIAKSVFDVINFIIFRGGEDFYGNGTLGYYVDPTTNVKNLKMRVIAMTDIARTLIQEEVNHDNIIEDSTGNFFFKGKNYSKKSGSVTPKWTLDSFDNESDYNDSLRNQIINVDGKARASERVSHLSGARFKGPVDMKGRNTTAGNLIQFTDRASGINQEAMRIVDFRETINKTGWFVQWNLEEDQKPKEEASS